MHRVAILIGLLAVSACASQTGGTPEPAPGSSQGGAPLPSFALPSAAPSVESGLHTIDIYVDLYDSDAWSEDDVTCVGEDGYEDIGPGLELEIRDETGEVLGSTALRQGFVLETGRCSFHAIVRGVPDAEVYVVSSEERGELRFSAGEMEANDWVVTMSIGA
jgi:hypothetical protein